MTRAELENAIATARAGVVIDMRRLDAFPSRVREVTILRDLRVVIEFNVYDHDEGGPRFMARYPDLDSVIRALEPYLGAPLERWARWTATGAYSDPPAGWTGAPPAGENERFLEHVAGHLLRLPDGEYEQLSPYWASVERSRSAYVEAEHIRALCEAGELAIAPASMCRDADAALRRLPWRAGGHLDWASFPDVRVARMRSPELAAWKREMVASSPPQLLALYSPTEGVVGGTRFVLDHLDDIFWRAPGPRFLVAVEGDGQISVATVIEYDGVETVRARLGR